MRNRGQESEERADSCLRFCCRPIFSFLMSLNWQAEQSSPLDCILFHVVLLANPTFSILADIYPSPWLDVARCVLDKNGRRPIRQWNEILRASNGLAWIIDGAFFHIFHKSKGLNVKKEGKPR